MSLNLILALIEGASGAVKSIEQLIGNLRGQATAAGATDADVDAAIARGRAAVADLGSTALAILDRLKAEGKA